MKEFYPPVVLPGPGWRPMKPIVPVQPEVIPEELLPSTPEVIPEEVLASPLTPQSSPLTPSPWAAALPSLLVALGWSVPASSGVVAGLWLLRGLIRRRRRRKEKPADTPAWARNSKVKRLADCEHESRSWRRPSARREPPDRKPVH